MDPKKLKEIIEKRNALAKERNELVEKAAIETRALDDDEKAKVAEFDEQIRELDETIELAKNAIDPAVYTPADQPDPEARAAETEEQIQKREIADFAAYVRAKANDEQRATNLTKTENGAIIPKTIANMIIKQIVEISPIYDRATKFPVKGTLAIPYYDEQTDHITVAWQDEFKEPDSHAGKFTTIELTGHLASALTLISKSLLNNNDFDLVSFMVNDMAQKIAIFLEAKLLHTDEDEKVDGLKDVKLITTAAAQDAVTADELIQLQDSIRDMFQNNAIWIMNRKTRTAIRLLKDQEGRYMLQGGDISSPFGTTLLGKPIYVTDAMPDMAADKIAIYYGDFSGLAVQTIEDPSIQVLTEHFYAQHAIGLNSWFEFDSKVMDAQKIAALKMAAGD